MRSFIRSFFFVVAIVGGAFVVNAQYRPLEKYNFDEGGYELVGIFEHHSDHRVQKTVGEFYTDDVAVLNKIKRAWNFPRDQYMHACGYHYHVVLLRNGTKVNEFSINLQCNEIVTERGSRFFDSRLLTMFATSLKPLIARTSKFTSIEDARRYWAESVRDKSFIFADEPKWLDFEGSFRFKTRCPASDRDCYMSDHDNEIIEVVEDKIATTYPNERFKIRNSGGTSGEIFFEIICNKSLESKFSIYERLEFFGKWEPFPLYLQSYWKTK